MWGTSEESKCPVIPSSCHVTDATDSSELRTKLRLDVFLVNRDVPSVIDAARVLNNSAATMTAAHHLHIMPINQTVDR